MRIVSGEVRLAAADVSNHLACHHLTYLELSAARGERERPQWEAPDLAVIQELGLRHERRYLEFLRHNGLDVLNLGGLDEGRIVDATLRAMEAGVEVIAQGALRVGRWFGRPDILRRVAGASRFGNWSYEAYDCKLARETKATTILQLAFYSELLGEVQRVLQQLLREQVSIRDLGAILEVLVEAAQHSKATVHLVETVRQSLGRSLVHSLLDADGAERFFRRDGETPKVDIHDPLAPHRELLAVYTDKDIHDVTAYLVTLK